MKPAVAQEVAKLFTLQWTRKRLLNGNHYLLSRDNMPLYFSSCCAMLQERRRPSTGEQTRQQRALVWFPRQSLLMGAVKQRPCAWQSST